MPNTHDSKQEQLAPLVSRGQVLIVEDEGIVAADIRDCLVRKGFQIAGVAESGSQAVQIARQDPPDLIVMDVRLNGDMDGIQAALDIHKTLGNSAPVIFVTGSVPATYPQLSLIKRFVYVSKPFSEDDLLEAVEDVLRTNREAF